MSDFDIDRRARIWWAAVAEPGDIDAAALIHEHGADGAMQLVLGSSDPAHDAWVERSRGVDMDGIIAATAKARATVLIPGDADFPRAFTDLADRAPFALWVRGDASVLNRESVCFAGARASTTYGEHVTEGLVAGAVERGLAIAATSDFGIGGAAHRTALAEGGTSIVFLSAGIDRVYPNAVSPLVDKVAALGGAVVSELPPGTAATRRRVMARDRLMTAAARATVIVEAGFRSGAFHIADRADDLGRPVGAVPGPVTSAASAGTHRLIREGAALITTPADVEELIRA